MPDEYRYYVACIPEELANKHAEVDIAWVASGHESPAAVAPLHGIGGLCRTAEEAEITADIARRHGGYQVLIYYRPKRDHRGKLAAVPDEAAELP